MDDFAPRVRVATALGKAVLVCGALFAATDLRAQSCTGCTPLDDASGPPYHGFAMGLYPGASNTPPPAHQALALDAAADIVPRDASGAPDANGWIGLVSIGMSNTNQEFAVFERAADANVARNARVIVVDGAVGGQSADVIVNPSAPYWSIVDARVAAAGLDPDQVQAIWLKQADGMLSTLAFPAHAETLQAHVRGIVTQLKDRFPKLSICYLASRIYGGYSSNPQRNEPVSYEGAFAFRGLIEDQIAGDPGLNADPNAGPVEAPVLLWGPYLWANGTIPRPSDGLTWVQADYEGDFVHPSPLGEAKVAGLLTGFFANDPTALAWYATDDGETLGLVNASADAFVSTAQPATNFGTQPFLSWDVAGRRSYVRWDLAGISDPVLHAKLSLECLADGEVRGCEVVVVSDNSWNELTITAGNAPPFDGLVLGIIPSASRGTAISLDVTHAVNDAIAASPGTAKLTLGLRPPPSPPGEQRVSSRESADAPRLVLTRSAVTAIPAATHTDAFLFEVTPNPASDVVTMRIAAGLESAVVVDVLDVRGVRVRRLVSASARAVHQLSWDGRDDSGAEVANGVYFLRTRESASGDTVTRKLSWIR